jgi:general secretion pathway protein J
LLEVLVALAILGFLFVGLAEGSHFVVLGWDRQTRLAARNEDLDGVDRTLRSLIAQAKPSSDWEKVVFAGTSQSVTFTSIMKLPTAGAVTQRVDVALGVDGAHRLMLVWTPHLHAVGVGRPPAAVATEILQGVERLDLAYWPATQGGGWTRVWRDLVPPRLVRIRIVFSDTSRMGWPDLLVAPMMDPS